MFIREATAGVNKKMCAIYKYSVATSHLIQQSGSPESNSTTLIMTRIRSAHNHA